MVLTQQTISSCEKNLTGSQRISLFLSILGLFAVGHVIDTLVLFYYFYIEWRMSSSDQKKIIKYFTFMSSFQVLLCLEDTLYNSTAKNNILSQKCFIQLCNFVWFANMHEFSIKNNDYHNFWGHILMCVLIKSKYSKNGFQKSAENKIPSHLSNPSNVWILRT